MKVLTVIDGRKVLIELPDIHSGISSILPSQSITVEENKQMINFTMLTIDGDLILDGDLWLA